MTPRPDLKQLATAIHANAVAKGFYENPPNIGTRFMLIISEASEALEADRKWKRASLEGYELYKRDSGFDVDSFKDHVKDTLEDEIADIVIRTLDYCAFAGIDVSHIEDDIMECLDGYPGTIAERLLSISGSIYYASVSANVEDFEDVRTELGEVIDKCFCLSVSEKFDLIRHIELKMAYNQTRAYKHGKAY